MAASRALKNTWAMHHPSRTTGMLGANATMRTPREPTTRPMTIHGRLMPRCDEVRSLILPKKGLARIDSRAPIPATSDKLLGACLIPTSELTFNARVTSKGAMNNRLVLMNANVYSEMKPHPTRCAAGDSGSSAASAAVRNFIRSNPGVGGSCGSAMGVRPQTRETSGIALSFKAEEPGDLGRQ